MCDILHMRHTHLWLKPDLIFNFTKYAKEQVGLLDLIHGLTNNVSINYLSCYYNNVCYIYKIFDIGVLILGIGQEEGRILEEKELVKRDPRHTSRTTGSRRSKINTRSRRSTVRKLFRSICWFEGRFGRWRRRNR